jgi:hypothetical protein
MSGGESIIGEPGPRELARIALDVLEQLPDVEGRRIYDHDLKAALEPLRRLPAIEVLCGRRGCHRRVAWWGLDYSENFVAAAARRSPPKSRTGGIDDLGGPSPRLKPGLWPWIELAESGTTSVRLVDTQTPGYPIRLKFVCKCGADYTLTNTTRLRAYLETVRNGTGHVLLNTVTQ